MTDNNVGSRKGWGMIITLEYKDKTVEFYDVPTKLGKAIETVLYSAEQESEIVSGESYNEEV